MRARVNLKSDPISLVVIAHNGHESAAMKHDEVVDVVLPLERPVNEPLIRLRPIQGLHQRADGWWFLDETGAINGPYQSSEEASVALVHYVRTLGPAPTSVRFIFAWYDLWIGVYWDRHNRDLYVMPVPCCGIVVHFA